jgi:hypothetical protein
MLAINYAAAHIGSTTVMLDVEEDLKTTRARAAVESKDQYLLAEWLVTYCPEQIGPLVTLKNVASEAGMLWQIRWTVACEADLQDLIKELYAEVWSG